MDQQQFINRLSQLIEDAKTAILATTGQDGRPHMRWMTPCIIHERKGALFAVTSPHFAKVVDLDVHPEVEWMVQTRALDQIINLRGKMNVIDNPSIKMEVIEHLGGRLSTFWKNNQPFTDFIVLETIIKEAVYFQPMKGYKETILFQDVPGQP